MIILASQSRIRRQLLAQAGVEFTTMIAPFDEEQAKHAAGPRQPVELAQLLARGKAHAAGILEPEAVVVGADQTLELDGRLMHKPKTLAEARDQLAELRGKYHTLYSAVAVTQGNRLLHQYATQARLKMRDFSEHFLETYLLRAGDTAQRSLGCYQIESLGIQLFETIEGDYFTIMGLPLLPLLAVLRDIGELPT